MIKRTTGYSPIIDGHADTLVRIIDEGGSFGHYCPQLHLDLPRLSEAGVDLQVMAICAGVRKAPYSWTQKVIRYWETEYQHLKEQVIWIRSQDDFERWEQEERIGIILALEGLEPLEGELSRLEEFYELGIRMFSLTWNWENPFAYGIYSPSDHGLMALGRKSISLAEEMGMILDLSHLGRKSFIDLLEIARQPVFVSHANVFAIYPHIRNLEQEQIKMIAATGGTIGLTFYPPFIGEGKVSCRAIIPHLEYILEQGGENCLALGSDFDGIETTPTDIKDVTGLSFFLKTLEDEGFNGQIISKLAGGNLYRFFKNKFSETS